ITVLENIRASGCKDLTCMGFCSRVGSSSITGLTRIQGHVNRNLLKTFDASSQAFFSPKLLPFTIQTIRSSRLEKLRLSSIKLSSANWDKLLRHLAVPTLVELRVDADCTPSTPIHFLARHPGINNLSVIPQPGSLWRTHQATASLALSLSTLDGPLSHVLPVLRSHLKPPTLACLALSLQSHDTSPDYLTTILRCVGYCNRAPNQQFTSDTWRSAPRPTAGDALALSASWIEAFPLVKRVSMQGCSNLTAEDLIHIMRKIADDDVELSVNLRPEDSL
ncbi:hypothetical protein DFH29DRAFT_883639, partial [Suillus ampliporus]